MSRSQSLLAAALALLVAPACAPVRAEAPFAPDEGYAVQEPYEPEDAPDPGRYRDELGSYGDWHDVPDYGVVWRPTYISGWQPYMDGYWAWTSYGWTWVSYEPWAWTLHYGRWMTLPAYGWVWVPGTVWGPAWVDWYWGAGYVGWAPLSPFGNVTVINNFVFVNEGDFCSRNVRRHVVRHHHVSDRVRRDWSKRDHRRSPRHDRIERVSRHGVTRIDGRPRGTLAPGRDRRHDARQDLTEARRERRDERRARADTEPRTVSRPAWGADDDARRRGTTRVRERETRVRIDDDAPTRRQPAAPGWSRRTRVETTPAPAEPRVRGPRFDRDDAGRLQVRPHAWGGGAVRRDARPAGDGPASPRTQGPASERGGGQRPGGGSRSEGGGRGNAQGGAARMSITPGVR